MTLVTQGLKTFSSLQVTLQMRVENQVHRS